MPKQAPKMEQGSKVERPPPTVVTESPPKSSYNVSASGNSSYEIEAIIEDIKSLAEESKKTEDLVEKENKYSQDVIAQFKEIVNWLDSPFKVNISAGTKKHYPSASEAVLDSRGMVSLNDSHGQVLALKPLEQFRSQTVLNIIGEVLPQVNDHLEDMKRQENERLSRIDKAITEITKIIDEDFESSS